MGWIAIRAGGSLTDGVEASFSRDVPSGADEAEHQEAYEDAHAFLDACKLARVRYDAPAAVVSPSS